MNHDLQKVSLQETALTPAKSISQTGEKNVYVEQVGTLEQNTTVIQVMGRSSSVVMRPTTQTVSTTFYHLFVMGGETFEQDSFIVPADRALSAYWTSEEVRGKHGNLSEESIEELKTYPALFMPEADGYYAKAGSEQQAFFGLVSDIRLQENGIKIKIHLAWPIPLQSICNIGFNLGMKDMDKALSEVNRTHWAIKRINLLEELKDANISIFGAV